MTCTGMGVVTALAAVLALAACTAATTELPGTPTTSSSRAATAVPTPTATSFPPGPSPAPSADAAAIRRAFGSGCASTTESMPRTSFTASIGDVDGDGRADTEWALIGTRGMRWGVTTASGATVSHTIAYASGGSRSVSIGTLSSGQTVALPSDGHTSNLYVLRDCRWVAPEVAGTKRPFEFSTPYGDPFDAVGGACVGGRLYQVYSDPTASGAERSGVRATISSDDRTVTTGTDRVELAAPHGADRYGDGCAPSKVLFPRYRG